MKSNHAVILDEFLEEANKIIMGLLVQYCSNKDVDLIDNMHMTAGENACDYMRKQGYLKNVNGRIYKFTKKGEQLWEKD